MGIFHTHPGGDLSAEAFSQEDRDAAKTLNDMFSRITGWTIESYIMTPTGRVKLYDAKENKAYWCVAGDCDREAGRY